MAGEKQLKGWPGKKKQALIAGDFDKLKQLANSKKIQKSGRQVELAESLTN